MKNIAPKFLRFLAWLIDWLISLSLLLVSVWIIISSQDINSMLNNLLFVFIYYLLIKGLILPIFNLILISKFGGTIGKLATGISIVNSNNQFISVKRAFFRNIVGYVVSGSLLFLGFIWILVDKEKRAWHDLMADTYVVVKNSKNAALGIILLIILLGVNIYAGQQLFQQIKVKQYIFNEIIDNFKSEINNKAKPNNELNDNLIYPEISPSLDLQQDANPIETF